MTSAPPDRFGAFGGRYVPETLIPALDELDAAFDAAMSDAVFRRDLDTLLSDFVGRPSALTDAPPPDITTNPAFLTKLTLIALGTVNALAVRFSGAWRMALATGEASRGLKLAAAFSLIVWIAALLAGRWIAFL